MKCSRTATSCWPNGQSISSERLADSKASHATASSIYLMPNNRAKARVSGQTRFRPSQRLQYHSPEPFTAQNL